MHRHIPAHGLIPARRVIPAHRHITARRAIPAHGLITAHSVITARRVITRAQALETGLLPAAISYRVRAGRWQRLAPAVYLTEPPATPEDLRLAAALHGGDRATISGAAALCAWGFRVPPATRELVLVPRDCHAASWGRIHVRKTHRPPPPRMLDSVPLAPPERAVADYAVGLHVLARVQAVVAFAVQQQLCTVSALGIELEAGPRRGSKHLREALVDVGYGAHSPAEALAGRTLRAAGLTHLEQNVEVPAGWHRYAADFLDRGRRAVIEIDSTQFHFTAEEQEATLARDHELQAAGYAVLHVKPRQVRDDPEGFVRIVRNWLAALDARTA